MSLSTASCKPASTGAKSWLIRQLTNDRVQTTLAAGGTKLIGSIYRVQDDKDAPDAVQRSTKKREGLLLGLTLAITPVAESLFTKHVIPQLQKVMDTAPFKKVMMVPPIMVGLAAAETLSRIIYPKPHRTFDNGFESQRIDGKDGSPSFKGAPPAPLPDFASSPRFSRQTTLNTPTPFAGAASPSNPFAQPQRQRYTP